MNPLILFALVGAAIWAILGKASGAVVSPAGNENDTPPGPTGGTGTGSDSGATPVVGAAVVVPSVTFTHPNTNSWWPELAVLNGRIFLSCGLGAMRFLEVAIGATLTVLREETLDTDHAYPAQPLDDQRFTYWQNTAGGNGWRRFTIAPLTVWTPALADDSAQCGGNWWRARDGKVAENLNGQIRINGVIGDTNQGATISTCDGVVTYPSDRGVQTILALARANGTIDHVAAGTAMQCQAAGPGGTVAFQLSGGPVFAINESGAIVDTTVTPWRQEFLGDSGAAIGCGWLWRSGVDQRVWLASASVDPNNGQGYIHLRPIGDVNAITIARNASHVRVVEWNNAWVIASAANGTMTIDVVATSAPRTPVTAADPSASAVMPVIPAFSSPKFLGAYLYPPSTGPGLPPELRDGSSINMVLYDAMYRRLDTRAGVATRIDLEYLAGQGVAGADLITAVKNTPRPRQVYFPAYSTDRNALIPDEQLAACDPGDLIEFPIYAGANETWAECERDSRNVIARLTAKGFNSLVAAPVYNLNGAITLQKVLDGLPVAYRLAELPGCVGINFFGIGRRNGTVQFPLLIQAIKLFHSDGGVPSLTAPTPDTGGGATPDGGTPVFPDDAHLDPSLPFQDATTIGIHRIGSAFADANGARPMLSASGLAMLQVFRDDLPRCTQNLQYLGDHHIDWVRVIFDLDWANLDPATDTTLIDLASRFTDLAWSFGVRTQWTILGRNAGRSFSDATIITQRLIQAMAGRADRVALYEVVNEVENGPKLSGPNIAKNLANLIRGNTPNQIAISAIQSNWDLWSMWYANSAATCATPHFDRSWSGEGGPWRPAKQNWDGQNLPGCPGAFGSNEPIGPEASGQPDSDPLRLCMNAATCWITGGAWFCYHSGAGVGFVVDPAHNRPANYWEETNGDAILSSLNAVRSILPKDIANWTKQNIQWPGSPWVFDPGSPLEMAVDGSPASLLRVYTATQGNEFYAAVIGCLTDQQWRLKQACKVDMISPLEGNVIHFFNVAANEPFVVGAELQGFIFHGIFQ